MKIFLIIIFLFILFSTHTLAQIDTTSLSFYPLNNGDYWEYEVITTDYSIFPYGYYQDYYSFEVMGDTIFPINNKHKIIKSKKLRSTQLPYYLYEKVDSTTCNVYRYDTYFNCDFLIDSLKSLTGDSCKATRTFPFDDHMTICTFNRPDNILNRVTNSKTFVEQHWHAPIEYKLSKGFGLTYLTYYYDFGTFTQQLLFARIDSIEYGTQVNSIPEDNSSILNDFHLYQNYPNPFNPITKIKFSIPNPEYVTLKIFNMRGQEVNTLVSDKLNTGDHTYTWDASNYASGVYIIQLQSNQHSQIKKCLLIK